MGTWLGSPWAGEEEARGGFWNFRYFVIEPFGVRGVLSLPCLVNWS